MKPGDLAYVMQPHHLWSYSVDLDDGRMIHFVDKGQIVLLLATKGQDELFVLAKAGYGWTMSFYVEKLR